MKIQKLNNTDYIIYIFSRLELEKIKETIKSIQKRLKLNGFYKLLVIDKSIGTFIKLTKLENAFYKDTLDLKIEKVDCDVYFKTDDYFIIKDISHVMYNDKEYYGLVDDSFDKILEKVEFGDFVLDIDINKCYVI